MGKRAAIVGAGQTYHKSIRRDVNGQELINEAVTRALEDAELTIDDIDGVVIQQRRIDDAPLINDVSFLDIETTRHRTLISFQ